MVTDLKPWSVATAKCLREIVNKGIPVLGICYGHQLLAQALDGIVDYHPDGKEYGEVDIGLTPDGEKDPLLSVLPSNITGYAEHAQSIIKLPPNARVLAREGSDVEKLYGSIRNNDYGRMLLQRFFELT